MVTKKDLSWVCLIFGIVLVFIIATTLNNVKLLRATRELSLEVEQTSTNQSLVGLRIENDYLAELERVSAISNLSTEPIFEQLDIPLSLELQIHTYNQATRIGIEPEILFALMRRESGFQEDAWVIDTNGFPSHGLFQINEIAFPFLIERGIDPKESPAANITAASEIIFYYLNERNCTLEEALAAYGVGYSNMLKGKGFYAANKLIEESSKFAKLSKETR